jgi:hypothetical protein
MIAVVLLVAVLVVVGGVAAVAASTPRLAVLGLLLAVVGAAYVSDPVPGITALLLRLAGSTLGIYLVWVALRRAPQIVPASSAGWLGSAAIAGVAFAAGFLAADRLGVALASGSLEGPGIGGVASALVAGSLVPRAAMGAAFALAALAIPAVALGRDTLRIGIGLLLLLAATSLVGNALVGRPDAIRDLAMAALTAVAGAGIAALIGASMRRGGELTVRDTLRPDAAVRHRAADDAHPGRALSDRPGGAD